MPQPNADRRGLPEAAPFVGPEAIERRDGVPTRARIGANENPFGPAPSVLAAMRAAARDSWHYGDPENHDLRAAVVAALLCRTCPRMPPLIRTITMPQQGLGSNS